MYENQRDSALVDEAKKKDDWRVDRSNQNSNEKTSINYEFDTVKPKWQNFLLY
jgi:hypothetical protein